VSSRHSMASGLFALVVVAHPYFAKADQTTPADLTATPAAITITVLAGGLSQPASVAITASQAVPASDTPAAAMLGDLVRDDSAARIGPTILKAVVTRDSADTTDQSFVLTLTPDLANVDPGKYSGNVRVSGPSINPLVIPVTLSIQGGSVAEALALLLFGLSVGWLLKWYADSGSKLSAQSRRYDAFLRRLGTTPLSNLPKFVLNEMDDVNQGLRDLDQARVETALALLEGQIAGLASVTNTVAHLRESLQAHQTEIEPALPYHQICDNERRRLNDALNEATDLPSTKDSVSSLLTHAKAISDCLQNPADPLRAQVLSLYNDDRFDDALNAYETAPPPAVAPPAVPGAGAAVDPGHLQLLLATGNQLEAVLAAPGWPAPPPGPAAAAAAVPGESNLGMLWRLTLNPGLPFLVAVVTVLVIALIGLTTQWSSNVTFGAGGVIDQVALFLWGVAAFVTGKTASDFVSTVVSQ
jgi:hypothetical protein